MRGRVTDMHARDGKRLAGRLGDSKGGRGKRAEANQFDSNPFSIGRLKFARAVHLLRPEMVKPVIGGAPGLDEGYADAFNARLERRDLSTGAVVAGAKLPGPENSGRKATRFSSETRFAVTG